MLNPTPEFIREHVADSEEIYLRGCRIYNYGAYHCMEMNPEIGFFEYEIDGSYGDYKIQIQLGEDDIETRCNCPYPGNGCKHIVAALMDANDVVEGAMTSSELLKEHQKEIKDPYLKPEEIRDQALKDRKKRAKSEKMKAIPGDMFKGEHTVESAMGRKYTVTLHDPANAKGHCTCPDFLTNRLHICKHLIFLSNALKNKPDFAGRLSQEKFPFIDIFWDSEKDLPRMFNERPKSEIEDLSPILSAYFDDDGVFAKPDLTDFIGFLSAIEGRKRIVVRESVLDRVNEHLENLQIAEAEKADATLNFDKIAAQLYPYQNAGVRFGMYRRAVLIGDEMGLGKTLQAIVIAIFKKKIFGFKKALVVTPASLKEQWKREIERFCSEKATVISGNPKQRMQAYQDAETYFKIANYESVLRDGMTIFRFRPDLVILDEAQRIKNFNTKTADAIKRIPRKQAIVLTGTPLENRLEDIYSIVQFLAPRMLAPLWKFAADHFMLSRNRKGKILGYRNLEALHENLKSLLIRRRKEDVLDDLPRELVNNYYIDLTPEQKDMHAGYVMGLYYYLNKKFLTPLDMKKIMLLLQCMRRTCDSTYLIDRKTNFSPKLNELKGIIEDLVIQNNRKVVIFSEWTTMTFLIAKEISSAGIPFVELSGKIPVNKRQALIDEFNTNPDCKVFLSTDAGGVGLNLQAADCVVNFELPWSPAKMNQRIGRVNRIGQQSKIINVVNLIAKDSIEEKILTGIQLKTELFHGVLDGTVDEVGLTQEKRTELLNKLREMLDEEPVMKRSDDVPIDEIPEDLPQYLNPEAIKAHDERMMELSYDEEEAEADPIEEPTMEDETKEIAVNRVEDTERSNKKSDQSPEKMEEVLNSGLSFLSGVMEMATGQKLEASEEDKMITIDRNTGEVTLKFKLPGF